MPQNAATRRPASIVERLRFAGHVDQVRLAAWAHSHQAACGASCRRRGRESRRARSAEIASARLRQTTWARCRPADRLAQRAARKHVVEAERLQRIEQHDVQIAGQPAMLEAVVQQDRPGARTVSIARSAAATRSGFCTCGTSGSDWRKFQRFVVVLACRWRRSRG